MFIDIAELRLAAGNGGDGRVCFRQELFEPDGGPNGGDGGNGGSIFFIADENVTTLMDIAYKKEYKAEPGERGKEKDMHGKSAKNIYIKIPVGSIIRNKENNQIVTDLVAHGQKELIAKGGRGGRGNSKFVSSTNRAPQIAESGKMGEEITVIIEVKLIADVGLVGFPNAGKSTLLSVLSAARPKIANYPFTTLEPQLGIVKIHDYETFVMADIPGIIEGASDGKGLGIKFLKHIERTKTIVYMIDGNEDIKATYKILNKELKKYSKLLAEKPAFVIITKSDTFTDIKIPSTMDKHPVIAISSLTRHNLNELKEMLWNNIKVGREMFDIVKEDQEEKDNFNF